MNMLKQRALARLPATAETIEDIYFGRGQIKPDHCHKTLCESHERLRAELQGAEVLLDAVGGWKDWKQDLRDFAEDSEQHTITHAQWKQNRGHGVTLYCDGNKGFFTAYFDDAADLWGQADDDLPMFHVMIRSDAPHRTCIHPIHLAAWAKHLAGICMPLDIKAAEGDA